MILNVMASSVMNVPGAWGIVAFAIGVASIGAVFWYFSRRF